MNKFNFKIIITGSIDLPMYDDNPDLATYESYGYSRSFIFEGSLSDAMRFAQEKCDEKLITEPEEVICFCDEDEHACDCWSYEPEPQRVIRPYLVEIKSLIHKNTIVGGDAQWRNIKWVIPSINEDLNKVYQRSEELQCEASEESGWDNFDSARQLRFQAVLEMLKCSDYWKYMTPKQVA